MKPVHFEGVNKVYVAPKNWDAKTMGICSDLPVRKVNGAITSCYELTKDECAILYGGGKLYFTIYQDTQPVVGWKIG